MVRKEVIEEELTEGVGGEEMETLEDPDALFEDLASTSDD